MTLTDRLGPEILARKAVLTWNAKSEGGKSLTPSK